MTIMELDSAQSLESRYWILYVSMFADIDIDILSTHIIHTIEQTVSGLRPEIPYEARLIIYGSYSIYLIHKNSSTRISMNTQTINSIIKPIAENAEKKKTVRE